MNKGNKEIVMKKLRRRLKMIECWLKSKLHRRFSGNLKANFHNLHNLPYLW